MFKNQIFKNLERSAPLLDQAIVSGGNFLVGLLLARFLGVSVFGAWASGQLAMMFVVALGQAFFTTPMLTFLGKKPADETHAYLLILRRLQVAGAVLAAVFSGLFFGKFWIEKSPGVLLGPAAVFFALRFDFERRALIGLKKMGGLLRLDALNTGLQLAALGFLSFKNWLNLETVWAVWAGSMAVSNFVSNVARFLKPRNVTIARQEFDFVLKQHWREGRWLAATAVLQWFAGNWLMMAAGLVLGQAALGLARMAQNIVGLLNIALISLENSLPTPAARAWAAGGPAAMWRQIWSDVRWLVAPVGGAMLLAGWFAEPLFRAVFGEAPAGTRLAVWGMVAVYAFSLAALPLRVALRTVGSSHRIFMGYAFSAVFSLLAGRFLLENFGLPGLFGGLVFCQIIQILFTIDVVKQGVARFQKPCNA